LFLVYVFISRLSGLSFFKDYQIVLLSISGDMEMKNIIGSTIFILGLSFALTGNIAAKDLTSKEEVEKLLSGNTVELQDMKWNKSSVWYFKKNGRLKTQDEHGNRGKGEWYVDDQGRLCTEKKHRKLRCRVLVTREDGGYDVYEREYEENELKWIFKRILPGNPNDL
jgi:hypothetical protein